MHNPDNTGLHYSLRQWNKPLNPEIVHSPLSPDTFLELPEAHTLIKHSIHLIIEIHNQNQIQK